MSFTASCPLNLTLLRERCFAKIRNFAKVGKLESNLYGRHFFQDNNANILAIAHLDTVQSRNNFSVGIKDGKKIVYCPKLDDRLGVYIILDLLPKLGVKCDVLLTENEECCSSTAQDFLPNSYDRYNWMFEFDRIGTDVVMYQYLTKQWEKIFKHSYGLVANDGSYTDIVELDFLGVSGFNFGCGYHNNHSKDAYFVIEEMLLMVRCFLKFYKHYKNTRLEFVPKPRKSLYTVPYERCSDEFGDYNRMLFEEAWLKYVEDK